MRTFVYSETRKPDLEKRREILEHLVRLRKYPTLKDLKKHFRRELRKTYGFKTYYIYYKGLKFFLGNQDKKHKFLAPFLKEEVIKRELAEHRKEVKVDKIEHKSVPISTVRGFFAITKTNGFPGKDAFFNINKKIRQTKVFSAKAPKTKDSYVGIELEYASVFSLEEVADKIAEAGLHDKLRVMRDASIVTDPIYQHQIELCLLTKLGDLDADLEKLQKIIVPVDFNANNTCGFHVHLDARQYNVKKMFHNLVCMQSILFSMVAEHRRESKYCRPLNTPNFDEVNERDIHAHWDAISKFAFFKHKTVEVRMHESTCNLAQVSKWVKLLRKIADYQGTELKFGNMSVTNKQISKLDLGDDLLKFVEEKQAI